VAQMKIPAVIMRGGTSRGVFFRGGALPEDPAERDAILLRTLGSPDPFGSQVDGLGGATSSTSKAVVVSLSSRPDSDVDYLFGQVSIDKPLVDYSGNCGNLSSAVGPFALEEGLVRASGSEAVVRIWQVNTRKRIIAHVPLDDGLPAVEGDFSIDGVPNPGPEIRLEFFDPGGTACARLLPTGQPQEDLDVPGLGTVSVSLLDAGNPAVLVRASDLGLTGTELREDMNRSPDVLTALEAVRSHGAVAMGLGDRDASRDAEGRLRRAAGAVPYVQRYDRHGRRDRPAGPGHLHGQAPSRLRHYQRHRNGGRGHPPRHPGVRSRWLRG
jgi:2-methylaconitate isomerase